MTGDVDVLGQQNFLDVWNHERFVAQAAARAVHRRRRAGAGGVRDLSTQEGESRVGRDVPRAHPVMVDEVAASSCSRSAAARSSTARSASAATRARCSSAAPTRLIGLDRDPTRWRIAREALGAVRRSRRAGARRLPRARRGARRARHRRRSTGVLADLGVSSMQLDARGPRLQLPARRAARHADGSRRAARPRPSCWPRVDETELADVIFQFGEERHSRRIARAIVDGAATRRRSRRPGSSRTSCGARSPHADGSGSIRRRARSRRCASGSTASSTGSIGFVRSAAARLQRRRRGWW